MGFSPFLPRLMDNQHYARTKSGRRKQNSANLEMETTMKKLISALLVAVFAVTSVSAIACGDKAKDEKQMSTPSKPKV